MFAGIGYARYSAKAAMGLGAQLRQDEYRRMESLLLQILISTIHPLWSHDLHQTSLLFRNALQWVRARLWRGPIMLVMGLVMAFIMSPELAVVYFAVLPFLAIALFLL